MIIITIIIIIQIVLITSFNEVEHITFRNYSTLEDVKKYNMYYMIRKAQFNSTLPCK